jgi:hypothetical protein
MESTAFEDAAKVKLSRGLLVWMDEGEQRLSDKNLCLGVEMIGENRVDIDKLEVGREECPV